jgi:thioredoxin 1
VKEIFRDTSSVEEDMTSPQAILSVATPEEFRRNILEARGLLLALFHARWCPFCRSFMPVFHRNSREAGPKFVEVDISDYDNPLWEQYAVEVIPTLILFRDGRPVARADGIAGRGLKEDHLRALLERQA